MAKEDWSEAKAWMRATRERIGMTQHDAAVLANLTVDMVKKYESEKYRIQPSGRMREMLEHYLAEHRRAVAAIMERHRGDERAVLSFSRVSNLPEGLPDWVRAEESVKRRAAAVREAAVLLEAEGVAVDYTYHARRNGIEEGRKADHVRTLYARDIPGHRHHRRRLRRPARRRRAWRWDWSRIPSARSPWYSTSSPPLPPAWR